MSHSDLKATLWFLDCPALAWDPCWQKREGSVPRPAGCPEPLWLRKEVTDAGDSAGMVRKGFALFMGIMKAKGWQETPQDKACTGPLRSMAPLALFVPEQVG